MWALAKRMLPYAVIVLLSAWIASQASSMGDWDTDSYPAVHALSSGQLGAYLEATPMMGPVSTIVQAPFAALSVGTEIAAYRWASFPCLLAVGLLGLYLASIGRRRGASPLAQAVLALVPLLNPITFEAMRFGHPEELLTAALAIAAIASASEGHRTRAAVLLGLAIASKQWALIAVLPTLMALPGGRLRAGAVAAAVAAILILPGLVAAPDGFMEVHGKAADTGRVVTPWSVWYPAAPSVTETYRVDGKRLVAEVEEAPPLVGSLSHPLILVLAVLLPLALALRRGGFGISGSEAMALFALLALLRCALDPVDNFYYHEPLLLALVGWDAFSSRGLPLRSLIGVGVALLFAHAWHNLSDPVAFNLAYLGVATGVGFALLSSLFRPFHWTGVPVSAFFALRSPNFRD
jgi:hypothetical protein